MRKLIALSLLIALFTILPVASYAQEFKEVADGVEYAELMRGTEKEPVRMTLLRLDLMKVRLDVVHALDAAVGLEKTSSMATRHGAIAAINAGFFKISGLYNGDDVSALQIDGKLISESYGNRIALGIANGKDKTEVDFAHVSAGFVAGFGIDNEFAFSGVNRERKPNEIVLYTPEFHRTTLTDPTGTEIILSNCARRCGSAEVVEGRGSSLIPHDGFVISIGKNALAKSNNILQFLPKKGKKMTGIAIRANMTAAEKDKQTFFEKSEDITTGVPQLIKDGKIEITWEAEKTSKEFVETKHPRTAIAKLKDGKLLMVAVDGRQPAHSIGIGLNDLAELLLELGAVDAMNLDGGGSTTMYLNGKIVNKPSDKEGERSVGDAILVFPRKK